MLGNRRIITADDARLLARKNLPAMVFDYIDGAAGEGNGEAENRHALRAIKLHPRILRNVETRTISGTLFGKPTGLPFGIAPMGMCNLSAPGADLMLARLAARHEIPQGVSTAASTPLEKIIEEAKGNAWFQLYYSADRSASEHLINRAQDCGYDVLMLTVDVPEVGRRPRELRRGFKMPFKMGLSQFVDCALHPKWALSTLAAGAPSLANFDGSPASFNRSASRAGADWDYLKLLRERWHGKLVVKGVLDVEDALRLRQVGVDAIQISSHGGRQLDAAPLPILALGEIRAALGKDFPLFYDSGLRSGEDIIKAYAMGANFAFLGRPFQFAIAAAGERGLSELCDGLSAEASITLAMLGVCSLDDVNQGSLYTSPATNTA